MSRVLVMLYKWLNVKRIRTSVYHPQTDGLVERFNQTLKKMLKKLVDVDGREWHQLIPYVLFAIREVPQASTGFSPFELLYGRSVRGPMSILKELWSGDVDVPEVRSTYHFVIDLRDRLEQTCKLARDELGNLQLA